MSTVWYDGVEELTTLTRGLGQVSRAALPAARAAVTKTCAAIEATAKVGAPVDTGNLRASIGFDVTQVGATVVGEVGPTAAYGAYLEYGTARAAPQPYMGPAFDQHAPGLDAALLDVSLRYGIFGG